MSPNTDRQEPHLKFTWFQYTEYYNQIQIANYTQTQTILKFDFKIEFGGCPAITNPFMIVSYDYLRCLLPGKKPLMSLWSNNEMMIL